jgi:hypothetical protein
MLNTFFFFFFSLENRVAYEIMWKYTAQPGRPQMTIWRKRIACWVLKSTNIHPEYVIPISFPVQQQTHLNVTLLVHCLSCFHILIIARLSNKKLFVGSSFLYNYCLTHFAF